MTNRAASAPALTRGAIFQQAWPIMLGQASIPLVGMVDAAVIGRTGDAAALAGVALGASVITMIFWSFGFLRMGVTGLASQADGRGDTSEVRALALRALVLALVIGAALLAASIPLRAAAFAILSGSEAVTTEADLYVAARLLGAPAALGSYAITGWLLGLGRTRAALVLQLVMNAVNIGADLWFVWGLGMGAEGVGYGTALAELAALVTGLLLMGRVLDRSLIAMIRTVPAGTLTDRAALARLLVVNRDIMVRTLAMLLMFTWFANAGARLGAVQLAANHVLLQFVSLAAFVLDAFAFTAEARVGHAIGGRDKPRFVRSVRLASEFSLAAGLVLALLFLALGEHLIAFIATDPAVRAEASRYLPFAAAIPLLGMPSWLLDGVFIGATRGVALRNAAVIAAALYLALDLALRGAGNLGVWIAFSASYLLRAGALGLYLPALLRDFPKPSDKAG
ncbi:MATE family efflux transporter [Altererythrobacter sp. KTW20L]|uniref:MATE family efflux transporter n=1 Tax=Altererythrobacter sp. KTW20L TaxID=2942210 RepID=UPI0020BE25B7|nr:MATE family efflux transporter [Altererythrobacter sp. KTW20L]MCL6251749.1 MATE family efflux transporter [Altererythrobacter sp. KTW20L]